MSIKDWPAEERPREKLLAKGAASLTDAELLALFLRVGLPGKSAVDLARDLLVQFGSLSALVAATPEAFCAQHGMGEAKYVQLQGAVELARRALGERLKRETVLSDDRAVAQYLDLTLRHETVEVFLALFLNSTHRLIESVELARGTHNQAAVYPREVARVALRLNASAVIFAHNHPGGAVEPSAADIALTKNLQQVLTALEVHVLDHWIVAPGNTLSFRARGLIFT